MSTIFRTTPTEVMTNDHQPDRANAITPLGGLRRSLAGHAGRDIRVSITNLWPCESIKKGHNFEINKQARLLTALTITESAIRLSYWELAMTVAFGLEGREVLANRYV